MKSISELLNETANTLDATEKLIVAINKLKHRIKK